MAAAGAQAMMAASSAYSQSEAQTAQAEVSKTMYDLNSKVSAYQADDAIRRGNKAAEASNKKTKQVIADQRVSLAAQGISIDSGSAKELQTETELLGIENVQNIKVNSWREAFGYKSQASQQAFQGKVAELTGNNLARNTLLTGGLQSLNYGLDGYNRSQKGYTERRLSTDSNYTRFPKE